MKILSLRFQNLNSLEGEWFIDFTHPDYEAGGIFAITGPTGSGKTTILDAVCLALYGRTPRLGRITESANEIMSRRQGECSAELVFEGSSGRFRAAWSQRRARKKPGGKLQEPRHEIAEHHSGRVIEAARSRTEREIIKASGMTFDQFTRSILLAQGEFAAFLKAEAEERADLLEQISGTAIYSRISMRVHARKNEEQEKLRSLEQELAQCPALDREGEAALLREGEAAKKAIAGLDADLAKARQAAARLETVAALEKKAALLAEKARDLESQWAAFQPDRERLLADRAAAPLDGPHSRLKTLRRQAEAKAGEVGSLEKKAEARAAEIQRALARARQEGGGGGALKGGGENREQARQEAWRSFEEFLGGRELSAWHGDLRRLTRKINDLDQAVRLKNDLAAARNEQGQVAAGLERDGRELEFMGQNIAAGDSLLQALTEQAEALESVRRLRLQVESLEGRRAELSAGRPCPLCGSLEHPWADPAARPAFGEADQNLKETRAAIKAGEKKLAGFRERSAALGQSLRSAAAQAEKLGLAIAGLEAEMAGRQETCALEDPGAARAALAREAAALEKRLSAAEGLSTLLREVDEESAIRARALEELAALTAETGEAEEFFKNRLPEAGFPDEAAYLAAALTPEARHSLTAAERALAEARAVNTAGMAENRAALQAEALAAPGGGGDLAQWRAEASALAEHRDRLQAALGVIEEKIREHGKAAGRNLALLERREQRRKEYGRWSRLHELIGSADGKKYRHFAQGLTFEVMVAQANLWLGRMSDRYLLVRDARQPLELCVIDNYQAGEIRGAKNLSGGECFIVSLALALGLSKMAGQNVRVDSLFLDEGFGALDEDSLDVALEALSSLREHGKLIGVISHVPALTDRIPIQIKVSRLPGGRATLTQG